MLFSLLPYPAYNEVKAEEKTTAEELLDAALEIPPEIADGKLQLPSLPDENYTIELAGSSNEAVIDSEDNVHQPLVDMDVKVMYKVTNLHDDADYAFDDLKDVSVHVEGTYDTQEGDNPKPSVIPGIREWKGGTGEFTLNEDSRIVMQDDTLQETADQIADYFQPMLGKTLPVVMGEPTSGDIMLKYSDQTELGEEGNAIDIGETIIIEAPAQIGILYGGVTITQIMSQSEGKDSAPIGMIRDYPAYEIRAAMMDVARIYIPIDYLEEITRYMAYFKMNEIHVHINDDGGQQSSAFRVESKKYPEINSTLKEGEVYTQEQYRQYQLNARKVGIDVITEIDTPAHCGFVNLLSEEHQAQFPDIMLDESHIDLGNEKAIEFIKSLYDEFLDGEDPVFISDNFHIGADEYRRDDPGETTNGTNYRKYVNAMIDHINEKGLQPRMWASLGGGGMGGDIPVDNRVISNYWAYSWADFPQMLKDGYRCINTSTDLYVVPGTSTGYVDFLDLAECYETWEVHTLGGGTNVSPAHPLLEGCESAIWYDREVGMSKYDYFTRMKDQIMLISEKGWYGGKDDDQHAEDFMERVDAVADRAPDANPARTVDSSSEVIARYDFDEAQGQEISDQSGNGYDAEIEGLSLTEGREGNALALDGNGHLRLPFAAVGFPYTVSFDLWIDERTPQDAVLFDGEDGTLYLNAQGIGYARGGYVYQLDAQIDRGRWQRVTLTCDRLSVDLYIDGVFEASAQYDHGAVPESSTFVLPCQRIGSGVIGKLDDLQITNTHITWEEESGLSDLDYRNLALGQKTKVSALEVEGQYTGDMAVDGIISYESRVSLERKDDAWFMVDLGKSYLIDKVEIDFNERPDQYQVWISEDGSEWTMIEEDLDCEGASRGLDTIQLDVPMRARYVKYQQLKMFDAGYSGNFYEFRVFGYAGIAELDRILTEAQSALRETERTEENAAYYDRLSQNVELFTEVLNANDMERKCYIGRQISRQTARLLAGDVQAEQIDTAELNKLIHTQIDRENYDDETLDRYDEMVSKAMYAYVDIDADQQKIDAYTGRMKAMLDSLTENTVTVSANIDIYNEFVLANAVDHDLSTRLWTKGTQEPGQYIQFEFRFARELSAIQVISVLNGDRIGKADVEVSMDGTTWTKVSELTDADNQIIEFAPVQAKYVRFLITETKNAWISIDEVIFDPADRSTLQQAYEEMAGKDLSAYTEGSAAAFQDIMDEAKALLEQLMISEEAIEAMLAKMEQADTLLQIKASVPAMNALQAIIDKANAMGSDDETMKIAINTAQALLDDQNDASVTAVVTALLDLSEAMQALNTDESTEALRKDVQATIDFINENILNNVEGLRPGKVEALKDAVKAVQDVVNDPEATADELKAANKAMTKAAQELWEIVAKTELEALIEAANGCLDGNYTTESLKALQAAIDAAQAVAANDDATTAEVTEAITNLSDAIAGLESIRLDKRALEHEIELVNEMLTNIDDYVPSSVEGLADKLADAQNVLKNAASQAEIDEATKTLREARLNARTRADVSALEELVAYVNHLDLRAYMAKTAEPVRALAEQANEMIANAEITQNEVDALAEELQSAIDEL